MVSEVISTNVDQVSAEASSLEQPVCTSYTEADEHDTEFPPGYYDERLEDYFPPTLMLFTRGFGLTNPRCQYRNVI
jgi:hypothetical protein